MNASAENDVATRIFKPRRRSTHVFCHLDRLVRCLIILCPHCYPCEEPNGMSRRAFQSAVSGHSICGTGCLAMYPPPPIYSVDGVWTTAIRPL